MREKKKSTNPYTVVSLGLIITVQEYNHMIRIDTSPKPSSPLLNRQENKKLGWLGKGETTRDSKWGFFSQMRSFLRDLSVTLLSTVFHRQKNQASFQKRAPSCSITHGPVEYLLWSWRCQGAEELVLLQNWACVFHLAQRWELNPKFRAPPEP